MPPAARIGDMHVCPLINPGPVPHVGGPINLGSPNVQTNSIPQARLNDLAVCTGPPDSIAMGSTGVQVNGQPAARMGDPTKHGGVIVAGSPNVIIGEIGGGGSGGSGSAIPSRPFAEGAAADQAAVAKVMTVAAMNGTPFCEQCAKAAMA